jgi:hypothetical protein
MNFQDFLNEGSKITLKRRYTENHPAVQVGKSAKVRNKMLEAIADGKITQEEFDAILKEYSKDTSKWIRRNTKYFNVSEDGISLSTFGKRALSQIAVIEEGNAFGAARAKAIADGEEEFTVDGETFKVKDVDSEDKENAEEFVEEELEEKAPNLAKKLAPGLTGALADTIGAPRGTGLDASIIDDEDGDGIEDEEEDDQLHEADRFEKEAKEILSDLMDEFDPWELTEMMPEEALETVANYGHKGAKAKKIADHLYSLASTGTFESKLEEKFKWETVGDKDDREFLTSLIKTTKTLYGNIKPDKYNLDDFDEDLDKLLKKFVKGGDSYFKAKDDNDHGTTNKIHSDWMKAAHKQFKHVTTNTSWRGYLDNFTRNLSTIWQVHMEADAGRTGNRGYKVNKRQIESKNNNKEMKNAFVYESFNGFVESLNENKYASAGKLGYNDQFLDRRQSLSKTLSLDLGLNPRHEFGGGDWLGFDYVSLYASGGKNTGTILDDALTGRYTYDELKSAAAEFLGIKESTNESEEMISEAFSSMKLQSILAGAGSMEKDFAKAFYNMAKIQLDKIQDVDIIEMDPAEARKEKRKNAVYLYFTTNEKENPYASEWAGKFGGGTIPANTLLGATNGKNEWLAQAYAGRGYNGRTKTLKTSRKEDSVGFGKSNARDSWGTGISSITKVAELADRAYVLDLDILEARYGTIPIRNARTSARKGAVAFKNDKDFKKDNLDRYHMILADRAAKMPIDKEVLDAIDIVSLQIKDGLSAGKKGRYGDVIIGHDPKGREVKLRDASNVMQNLLDDFNRYVDYTNQAKREEEDGYVSKYYTREVKNYAKSIKDRIGKIKKMDYVW